MAIIKPSYAASATITCTLSSLLSSSTIGRSSTFIDNTGNLFDDVLLNLSLKTSGTALGADKACYVYIFGSEDGSNFEGSSSEAVGTDVAVNINRPTNLKGPVAITTQGTSQSYLRVIPIAQFFSGRMPRKWGFVIRNATLQELDPTESNHIKTYTGIQYTVI